MNICIFDTCTNVIYAKGLCKRHYTQQRKGKPKTMAKPRRKCDIESCARDHQRGGLCAFHINEMAKSLPGDPLRAWAFTSASCIVPECQKLNYARGCCVNHASLKSVYNLSDSKILELFSNPQCELCGSTEKLSVDHRHDHHDRPKIGCDDCTRGLLCHRCNTGLGFFQEDVERMRAAIAYLNRHMTV